MIDNESQSRNFIRDVMSYCVNRKVWSFETTASMLTFLEQGHFIHLLLAHMTSPESEEYQHLKTIKQKFPRTCLVAMSNNAEAHDQAQSLGADIFLAKPFSLNDLFKIVQDHVVDKSWESPENNGLRN